MRRPVRLCALAAVCLWSALAWAAEPATRPVRVAMYDGAGVSGAGPGKIEAALSALGDMALRRVGAAEIQSGVLRDFDVLIVPGGSGSKQAAAMGDGGRAEVRKFVEGGGGYVGICGGCFLSTSHYKWSLGVINAKVLDTKHWARGKADLQIELTPLGKEILGNQAQTVTVKYHNGPILASGEASGPGAAGVFEPLAYFRTEVTPKGAEKGVMVNTPAMVAGRCGKGRVISISPHPEQTAGLEEFVPRAVRWTAGRAVTGPSAAGAVGGSGLR